MAPGDTERVTDRPEQFDLPGLTLRREKVSRLRLSVCAATLNDER